jgi:hypothetical protein
MLGDGAVRRFWEPVAMGVRGFGGRSFVFCLGEVGEARGVNSESSLRMLTGDSGFEIFSSGSATLFLLKIGRGRGLVVAAGGGADMDVAGAENDACNGRVAEGLSFKEAALPPPEYFMVVVPFLFLWGLSFSESSSVSWSA